MTIPSIVSRGLFEASVAGAMPIGGAPAGSCQSKPPSHYTIAPKSPQSTAILAFPQRASHLYGRYRRILPVWSENGNGRWRWLEGRGNRLEDAADRRRQQRQRRHDHQRDKEDDERVFDESLPTISGVSRRSCTRALTLSAIRTLLT